jgi:hypothetical protein
VRRLAEGALIISDLDGVLVDTYTALQWRLWDCYGTWVPLEAIEDYKIVNTVYSYLRHNTPVAWRHTVPMKVSAFRKSIDRFWSDPSFYASALPCVAYWRALLTSGQALRFATARPPRMSRVTDLWLGKYGFTTPNSDAQGRVYESIHFGKHKDALVKVLRNKYSHIVVVDDCPEIIDSIADLELDNVTPILVACSWSNRYNRRGVKLMPLSEIAAWIGATP